jgi:hypothetical protein
MSDTNAEFELGRRGLWIWLDWRFVLEAMNEHSFRGRLSMTRFSLSVYWNDSFALSRA